MAKQRKTGRRGKAPNKGTVLLSICAAIGVIFAALPTFTVLCVGLVPTAVAYIVDMTPGRYSTRCVAGLNVAGVVPFLNHVWSSGNDMHAAIGVVTDVFAWLAFYLASGIGWMLFMGLPGIVASIKTYNAQRRSNALRERLEELKQEWGPEVAGTTPAEAAEAAEAEARQRDKQDAGATQDAALPA